MKTLLKFVAVIAVGLIVLGHYKNAENIVFVYLYTALLVSIVLLIAIDLFSKRCRKCGKWGKMKVQWKTLADQKASHSYKTLKHKNRNGEVVRTEEIAVPATVYTYHYHRRCKSCGYEDIVVKTNKSEN